MKLTRYGSGKIDAEHQCQKLNVSHVLLTPTLMQAIYQTFIGKESRKRFSGRQADTYQRAQKEQTSVQPSIYCNTGRSSKQNKDGGTRLHNAPETIRLQRHMVRKNYSSSSQCYNMTKAKFWNVSAKLKRSEKQAIRSRKP